MRGVVACYFWDAIALFFGSWLFALVSGMPRLPTLVNLPCIIIGLVSMTALGALVFQKPVGSSLFWKVWL